MSAEPAVPPCPTVSADPVYLTVDEVATLLRVESVKTVYGWVKADPTMPVLKIGGTIRFPRARLMAWLQRREQGRPRLRPVQTSAKAAEAGS
jgi:excisionase family DNA binding protein